MMGKFCAGFFIFFSGILNVYGSVGQPPKDDLSEEYTSDLELNTSWNFPEGPESPARSSCSSSDDESGPYEVIESDASYSSGSQSPSPIEQSPEPVVDQPASPEIQRKLGPKKTSISQLLRAKSLLTAPLNTSVDMNKPSLSSESSSSSEKDPDVLSLSEDSQVVPRVKRPTLADSMEDPYQLIQIPAAFNH